MAGGKALKKGLGLGSFETNLTQIGNNDSERWGRAGGERIS